MRKKPRLSQDYQRQRENENVRRKSAALPICPGPHHRRDDCFRSGGITAKAYFGWKQSPVPRPNTRPFLTEGFDFNVLRTSENEWRGPDIGEKIDLTRLKTKEGKTLASMVGKRPVVLVSVNPECAMCRIAIDEMVHLHKKLSSMDINYYMVFFAAQTPQSDFFKYSDSLNVEGPSFLWNAEAGSPPESVFTMTTPSHLLLNSNGTVIRVWPGSYKTSQSVNG